MTEENVPIEKGIRMPKANAGVRVYPWDQMDVGDSFVVGSKANARQLCTQANVSRPGKKFEARIMAGVKRIWRTK